MAQDRPTESQTVSLQGGGSISLDQLVSATSGAVLRTLREHQTSGKLHNPKLWVGIWIDLDLGGPGGPGGPLGGPGGGPVGGGVG